MSHVRQFDPWSGAPAWAFELRNLLALILRRLEATGTMARAAISELERKMAVEFTALEAEVSRNTDVDTSANALLVGLTEEIRKLREGADPATQAKIDEFVAKLKTSTDGLVAAVEANTLPAPPPPDPVPAS